MSRSISYIAAGQLQALDKDEASGADGPEEQTAATDFEPGAGSPDGPRRGIGCTGVRHFSECSYEQIGDILKLPEKTVKSRIYMARQQLKDLLAARGVSQI